MSGVRPLDRTAHGSLRFDRSIVGSAQRIVQIGLSEIALVAADMPICLAKDANTGRFNLVALVGLVEPVNLFVHDRRFNATYCPRALQLTAFRLDARGVAGLAVDDSDPAIGPATGPAIDGVGDPLLVDGEPTPLATGIATALERLIDDIGAARALVDGYAALRLVRPLNLVLRDDGGQDHVIDGLYTIGNEALLRLPDADIVRLHRSGALAAAAVLTTSLMQVERLCQLNTAAGRRPLRIARLSHDDVGML